MHVQKAAATLKGLTRTPSGPVKAKPAGPKKVSTYACASNPVFRLWTYVCSHTSDLIASYSPQHTLVIACMFNHNYRALMMLKGHDPVQLCCRAARRTTRWSSPQRSSQQSGSPSDVVPLQLNSPVLPVRLYRHVCQTAGIPQILHVSCIGQHPESVICNMRCNTPRESIHSAGCSPILITQVPWCRPCALLPATSQIAM